MPDYGLGIIQLEFSGRYSLKEVLSGDTSIERSIE